MKLSCRSFYSILLTMIFLVQWAYAQTRKEYSYTVCYNTASVEYLNDVDLAGNSGGTCRSGTQVRLTNKSSTINTLMVIERLDGGPHRTKVKFGWLSEGEGEVSADVEYRKMVVKWDWFGPYCDWTDWRYLYSIKVSRKNPNPGGRFLEPFTTVGRAATDDTENVFKFLYVPTGIDFIQNDVSNPTPSVVATNICYFNGKSTVCQQIRRDGYKYIPTELLFYTKGMGKFTLNTSVHATCLTSHTGPSVTITVDPSCINDNKVELSTLPAGVPPSPYKDGSIQVIANQTYKIEQKGLTDFFDNYTISTKDLSSDIVLSGAKSEYFTVLKPLGSYTIDITPRNVNCFKPDPLQILVGNSNTFIEEICSITLPDYLQKPQGSLESNSLVFKHFALNVESSRSVIIKPGIELEEGAELFVKRPPPSANNDLNQNFIEKLSYDEYGFVASHARNYFDDTGLNFQNQWKDLTRGVIMAQATVYDAFGRPALTTLPAPVQTRPPLECAGDDQKGANISFNLKEDFVTANGVPYNATHFDLDKELSPLAVDDSEEGSLGWYYGTKNGNTTSQFNEVNVPVTNYPYSRILYDKSGKGIVKSVTQPGDMFKAGSSFNSVTDIEPVTSTDQYLLGDFKSYFRIREKELGYPLPASIDGQFYKTISIDGSGKKSITYFDKNGNTIIRLYFGDSSVPLAISYDFFDDMGRLILSLSPKGLKDYAVLGNGQSNFDQIDKTKYVYNEKGQLAATEEKISGKSENGVSRSEFVYRRDGMIRFSQNQEQKNATPPRFSYTNYDQLSRPIESGEYVGEAIVFNSPAMRSILEDTSPMGGLPETEGTRQAQSYVYYDFHYESSNDADLQLPNNHVQRFVNGLVSYTANEHTKTVYSYDELGRVEWVVQLIKGLGIKTLDYRYGSNGQLQETIYQKGDQSDQFVHFYKYDDDGRLQDVYTSQELIVYDKFGNITNADVLKPQATYSYYLHGPLKRIELAAEVRNGEKHAVQGIDYVYTINGLLKAINSSDKNKDPGKDGLAGSKILPDAFGMTIDYFTGDYRTGGGSYESIQTAGQHAPKEQYTGLIKSLRWHSLIDDHDQSAYIFGYDKFDQFSKASWGSVSGNFFVPNLLNSYTEEIGQVSEDGLVMEGYDLNGNIQHLNRNGNLLKPLTGFADELKYIYQPYSNTLKRVDRINKNSVEEFSSYSYNHIGQMIFEKHGDETKYVEYDATGKVLSVYADEERNKAITKFSYDDRGFRLSKITYDKESKPVLMTWYVRDAMGSVVTTYIKSLVDQNLAPSIEHPIYGKTRLGIFKREYDLSFYELHDHLGNVRAVIGEGFEKEYMATMETERSFEENSDFQNVLRHSTSSSINKTAALVSIDGEEFTISNPNEVCRLNNAPQGSYSPNPVGTGIMLWVHPGDKLEISVYAKYAVLGGSNGNPVLGLTNFLTNTFSAVSPIDGNVIFDALSDPGFQTLPAWDKLDDQQPRAFLNYLLFDNNFDLQGEKGFDFAQVSTACRITEHGDPLHEKLTLSVSVEKEGLIYVYVSNESTENIDVYFDDLQVIHKYSNIVAGGDYYPFGLAIRDRQINREHYRYGYQGQFAEKDEETGWNHFELREYDPVIGRWTAPDPMGQFFSPYIGMGNNPVYLTDPRGGCVDANRNVIPCPEGVSDGLDGFHTTVLGLDYSFDVETQEYNYAGTFAHYQKSFPEFAGMSQSEAVAHWEATYSESFYKQWQQSVQREKDRENVARLLWLRQGMMTAGAMSLGALGGPNLKSPKSFNYTPRGIVVRPQLNINSNQLGTKFGSHKDASLPGYRTAAEYRDLIHKIYKDPNSLYKPIPNNAKVHAGEHHFYNNGNLLRLGPDGSFRSLYPIK